MGCRTRGLLDWIGSVGLLERSGLVRVRYLLRGLRLWGELGWGWDDFMLARSAVHLSRILEAICT